MSQWNLANVFSIDVRSLALSRVALAIIILQDLARRSLDLTIFYGDGGVLPSRYLETFWNGSWSWSLHLLDGGSVLLLVSMFVLHALAACALLLGFYTRVATLLTWLLVVSLHNANPLILQGEDVLLRAVLFVCIFLPLGATWSIDSWRAKKPLAEVKILSGWSVAYLLQIGFLYFFVSLYKHSPEWFGGTAIYYALSIDQYATNVGRYLLHFPDVLSFFTYSILIFQSLALFLLFFPVYTVLIRTVTTFLLILMHASFALSMNLGMFSAVSIASLTAFIPTEVWENMGILLKNRMPRIGRLLLVGSTSDSVRVSRTQALVSVLGIVYIFYIFLWHGGNILHPGQYVPFRHGFELPAKVLRIDQRWNLFAPYPYKHDGWIVLAATLESGEKVDLFRGGAPLSLLRPEIIYDVYPRPRWRRYFLSVWTENNAEYRIPFARYQCNKWNDGNTNKIKMLDIIYMVEWTPPPGEQSREVEQHSLLKWDCEKNAVVTGVVPR